MLDPMLNVEGAEAFLKQTPDAKVTEEYQNLTVAQETNPIKSTQENNLTTAEQVRIF